MNVLVLMCDQLRYDALGCHGNPYVATPNLDRLAAKSVRFTRAFCNSPLCGPTRHSLATGQYPYQHGVINNTAMPRDGMRTVAHHFVDHGYRTTCIGHMHWQRIETNDGREHVFPDHGYEHYDAITPDESALTPPQAQRRLWEQVDATQSCVGGPSVVDEEASYSRQIADAAIARLRGWHDAGERFLCWASFNDPHPPFFPPAELFHKYAAMNLPAPIVRPADAKPSQAGTSTRDVWSTMCDLTHKVMKAGYYGLIELADRQIGRILDTLDELNMWDDTIVLFTVDHGEMMGDFGLYMKSVMWEQATHIPMFLYHPGLSPGERDGLVEHIDVSATLCDLAGIGVPQHMHGRSLRALVDGDATPTDWRPYAFAQLNNHLMIRTERWKLVYHDGEPRHLFDLKTDPGELHDCLAERRDEADRLIVMWQSDHPDLFAETQRLRDSGTVRKKKRKPKVMLVEVS